MVDKLHWKVYECYTLSNGQSYKNIVGAFRCKVYAKRFIAEQRKYAAGFVSFVIEPDTDYY